MSGNGQAKAAGLLHQGLVELGIALPAGAEDKLIRYALELVKWNRKVNLIAKNTSLEDIVEKHFLDSLTLLPVLASHVPEKGVLLDIGSGAGFPGLVIKTACPERPVLLLEPRLRRVSFLNHIIRLNELTLIEVVAKRTEDLSSTPDNPFSVMVSRAVTDVHSFLVMTDRLASPGSLVICMQGASGPEQWKGEKDNRLFTPLKLERIRLPFSGVERFILLFVKRE